MQLQILVVEDDADIRELAELALTLASDHIVKTASDGVDAIETLATASFRPDIILLDVEMPRLNGYETCRMLKADARFSGIPVVFLSAHCSNKLQQKENELGASGTISKPFDLHLLVKLVEGFYQDFHLKNSSTFLPATESSFPKALAASV